MPMPVLKLVRVPWIKQSLKQCPRRPGFGTKEKRGNRFGVLPRIKCTYTT